MAITIGSHNYAADLTRTIHLAYLKVFPEDELCAKTHAAIMLCSIFPPVCLRGIFLQHNADGIGPRSPLRTCFCNLIIGQRDIV
ncbi:Uncharacterised protein [Klebsiella pneumoniae]|nr:Uncharacterised protein [Klebsiella pneumoniae]